VKKNINITFDKALLKSLDSYTNEIDQTRESIIEKALISYLEKLKHKTEKGYSKEEIRQHLHQIIES